MKEGLSKKLEIFANVAIIVVAGLLGFVLIKNYFFSSPAPAAPKDRIAVGTKVNFSEIDFAANKNTLLLVLSKDCHFCTESVPFYQKLQAEFSASPNLKLTAIFPQDVSTARKYMAEKNLEIADVYQKMPPELGVMGTPSILLVNEKGEVADTWFGKLPGDAEQKVFERLKQITQGS